MTNSQPEKNNEGRVVVEQQKGRTTFESRLHVDRNSEYSLWDWFSFWFRGYSTSLSTFNAVSNPHKYIEENKEVLPDRMTHDYYSRVYRFNPTEYVPVIKRVLPTEHAPMTYNYEDCMQQKRSLSIIGTFLGTVFGGAFCYAYNFSQIASRKRYNPFMVGGAIVGFFTFRFVIAPRTESCFEQIVNQALSERIISNGYNNMMHYYRQEGYSNPIDQKQDRLIPNWYSQQIDTEQSEYLNHKMRQHLLEAMKKSGCIKQVADNGDEWFNGKSQEIAWKNHMDETFKKEYPSHRKFFKFA